MPRLCFIINTPEKERKVVLVGWDKWIMETKPQMIDFIIIFIYVYLKTLII